MPITIKFNPFTLIIEIAQELWPELDCDIYFADSQEVEGEGKAYTVFPDDGGKPEVCINLDVPFYAAVELLAHELAHVAVGSQNRHNHEWEKAFKKIHEIYLSKIADLEGGEDCDS